MRFSGRNDAGQAVDYVTLASRMEDVSDGTEDGKIILKTIVAGTARSRMEIDHTDVVFNQDSIDSNFRVESATTANAFFVEGSSGNVGIGTASPSTALDVSGVGGISAEGSDLFTVNKVVEAGQASMYGDANNTHFSHNVYYASGWKSSTNAHHGQLIFDSSGNFKIRYEEASVTGTAITWDDLVTVTSDGNVLVGTTTSNYAVVGTQIGTGSNNYMTRSGANPLLLNRLSSDGDILSFMKDSTTVGSIGTYR
jgi:hypothetical protein